MHYLPLEPQKMLIYVLLFQLCAHLSSTKYLGILPQCHHPPKTLKHELP